MKLRRFRNDNKACSPNSGQQSTSQAPSPYSEPVPQDSYHQALNQRVISLPLHHQLDGRQSSPQPTSLTGGSLEPGTMNSDVGHFRREQALSFSTNSIVYPRQIPNQQAGSRAMYIYDEGFLSKDMFILDSDNISPLYTVEVRSFDRPNMIIRSATAVVGTVDFQRYSSSIQIQVHGHPFTLESLGSWNSGFSYRSPSFNHDVKTWRSDGTWSGGDTICLDARGSLLAKVGDHWNYSSGKRLELTAWSIDGGPAVDEFVVVGMALIQSKRRKISRSGMAGGMAGGVGASAGGSGSGSCSGA